MLVNVRMMRVILDERFFFGLRDLGLSAEISLIWPLELLKVPPIDTYNVPLMATLHQHYHIEDENGQCVPDKSKNPIVQKISTLVDLRSKTLDRSPLLSDAKSSDGYKYEVFGAVEHGGEG